MEVGTLADRTERASAWLVTRRRNRVEWAEVSETEIYRRRMLVRE